MFRSTELTAGTLPANAAILGYRLNYGMPVGDALAALALAEHTNEIAAAARRHPSWSDRHERSIRFSADPEWSIEEIRHAQIVLTRARHAFADAGVEDVTRLRSDGRYEVADHEDGNAFYCTRDDWCILEVGHPGDCDEEREVWVGADALYPVRTAVLA